MDELLRSRRLREYNSGIILQELKKCGALTKFELSHKLKLSLSTISNFCKYLEEQGFIRANENTISSAGRPANKISINPEAGYFTIFKFSNDADVIGVELLDFDYKKIASSTVNYEEVLSLESMIKRMKDETDSILRSKNISANRHIGVGLSIPGEFDKRRRIVFTPHRKLLNNVRLLDRMSEAFASTIVIENDANLIAQGYGVVTRGKTKDLLALFFSYGIGLGILIDGKVYSGHAGYAGEIGHIRSAESGKDCSCGAVGCLQTVATLRYILCEYFPSCDMDAAIKNQNELLARFAAALHAGDPAARRILERAGRSIGDCIGSLIDLFNPEVIGVCGNITGIYGDFIEIIRINVLKRSFIIANNDTPILHFQDYEDLMTIGAAEMIFNRWIGSGELQSSPLADGAPALNT